MASTDTRPAPFVVQGKRRNGTVTYHCPNADWALRKLNDFDRAGYVEIKAIGPDGAAVGRVELAALRDERRALAPADG